MYDNQLSYVGLPVVYQTTCASPLSSQLFGPITNAYTECCRLRLCLGIGEYRTTARSIAIMKAQSSFSCRKAVLTIAGLVFLYGTSIYSNGQAASGQSSIPSADLIQPQELVAILNSSSSSKPLVLQVGFHVLFAQAHIPQSEYAGPTSQPEGIAQLRKRVEGLPHDQFIVLYCGCCPWSHCPNVNPAYAELRKMGFTNVKVLYIADNFGNDWVDKGYPTAKGE